MPLKRDVLNCRERLLSEAKAAHGRWLGRGHRDEAERDRISLLRDAASVLGNCYWTIRENENKMKELENVEKDN